MGKLLDVSQEVSKFCIENNLSAHKATELVYIIMNEILGYDIEFEYRNPKETIEREYAEMAEFVNKESRPTPNALDVLSCGHPVKGEIIVPHSSIICGVCGETTKRK